MRSKQQKKPNMMMRVAGALLLLTLLSACLMPGLYGRYSSSTDGTDEARVAKFDVKLLGTSTDLQFNGSDFGDVTEMQSYSFTVESRSEVSLYYTVAVSFGSPPPAEMKLQLDSGEILTCDGSQTEFAFETFLYSVGSAAKPHELRLYVTYMTDDAVNTFDFKDIPVTISVTAVQKD